VCRRRVDICGDRIWFDAIALHRSTIRRSTDGIDKAEQLVRSVAVAQQRLREHDPQRRMRVLSAVFADAGHVSLYVSRTGLCVIEWGRQQKDQAVFARDQPFVDRRQGLPSAIWISKAGDDGPALGNGVDTAFCVLRRAQRTAVVEVRSPIPFPVPCCFECVLEPCRVSAICKGLLGLAARLRQLGKGTEKRSQEPAKPDAFTPSLRAHLVHSVIPVTRADERQAMSARLHRPRDRPRAVVVNG